MNKVKTNSSGAGRKIAPTTESLKSEQKDKINLEEKIDKLTIKAKNVNGLLNGVEHDLSSKVSKKNRKNNSKNVAKNHGSREEKEEQSPFHGDHLDEINNIVLTDKEDTSSQRLDSVPSTSDITKKCDQSDLKLTKSKAKSKKTDAEKASSSSTSSKSEGRCRWDEPESSDFDIMAYIKGRYGSENKPDEKDIEKTASSEKLEDTISEKIEITPESESDGGLKMENPKIEYVQYESELQMPMIMKIIQKDLSEPYSIYTYRYFIHNWPNLCFLVRFLFNLLM